MASWTLLAAAAVALLAATADAGNFLLNAGGKNLGNGFRCDTGTFSNTGLKYTGPLPTLATGGLKDVYPSHGYASKGDLEYKVPVPAGTYTVFLMWSDTTVNGPNQRLFTVKINGELKSSNGKFSGTLDVFKVAGGKNKPFFYNAGPTAAVDGFITVTLGRVDGKENPMLSGLAIMGANADAKVGTDGKGSCKPDGSLVEPVLPMPTPPTNPNPNPNPNPAPGPGGSCGTATTVTGKKGNSFLMNVGAGAIARIGFGGDNVNYIVESNKGVAATAATAVVDNGQWPEPQQDFRYTTGATLTYKVPMPAGGKHVGLLFTDSLSTAAGQRVFDIVINGKTVTAGFDAFKAQGKNKPGYKGYNGVQSAGGFITIQLKKVTGNPFINGIVFFGSGAGSLAIGGPDAGPCGSGGGSVDPAPMPVAPTPVPPTPVAPTPVAPTTPGTCGPAPTVTGKKANSFLMNAGAGSVARIGFGGDNVNYIVESDIGLVAGAPTPVIDNGQWPEPQQSQRYTTGPTLTYKIPMPTGTFTVGLLFTESYMSAAGQRVFDIVINGKTVLKSFDVFKAQGKNKPGYKGFNGIASVGGFISIQFKKVTENPFVNGIVIFGAGADDLAIGGPDAAPATKKCSGSEPSDPSGPGPVIPDMDKECNKKIETEFKDLHSAHAVTGGPYVETDFKSQGYALVTLDGTLSHSHFNLPPETGKIVKWEWKWKDATNPAANADGFVIAKGEKVTQPFPLGVTEVMLMVTDQFCNPSADSTTVTVNSATLPGAYCYLYDYGSQTFNTVPLPLNAKLDPKPLRGESVGDINFANTAAFGKFPFSANTFAVRCQFFLDVKTSGNLQYKVIHSGPVKVYHAGKLVGSSNSNAANQMTLTQKEATVPGLQKWEILYLNPKGTGAKLIFQFFNGAVIPPSTVRHDSGSTLPVIYNLSKNQGVEDTLLFAFGSAFVNGVKVKFGTEDAVSLESTAGSVQVRAPPGTGTVPVTITTEAGVSNALSFTYTTPSIDENPNFPLKFEETTLKQGNGNPYPLKQVAVIRYGPDGRLYCGSTNSFIHVLTINKNLVVTKKFSKNVGETWVRAVLGIAFDPSKSNLRVLFTTSTMFWKQFNLIKNDAIGWKNGKVKSVTMSGPNGDFNNDVKDVITGLPVSNHDHSVQAMEFLPNGKLVISIGGFTNGGVSEPGDKLGGFPGNPLSGAIIECPSTGVTNIQYSTALPGPAKITGGFACKVYAPGFRNSFGITSHTNGKLYATDNGPNDTFGLFSTNCQNGEKASQTIKDKLFLVQPGKCHGHPNLNRGRNGKPEECVFENNSCVKPLISGLQSSTNGIIEFRSNVFGSEVKGNLFLSKYATANNNGRVSRVVLNGAGTVAPNGLTNIVWPASGLSMAEGPRGELVMSRVQRNGFIVLKPAFKKPSTTMFISVMPRRGPTVGGNKILVTGHNFGSSPSATIGGKACTNVVSIDDDSFTCTAPSGAKNSQVKIMVAGKTGAVSGFGNDYWYQ